MQTPQRHISLLLDRSGSMNSIRDDIIGSVNRFWNDQKMTGVPTTATMMLFDSQNPFDCMLENRPIEEVPELNLHYYQPRGGTPLLDAIGSAINSLSRHILTVSKESRPNGIIFVVVTDGQENSSIEFSHADIKNLILEKEAAGWQVEFLSSDLDAIAEFRMLTPRESKSVKINYSNANALHLGLDMISRNIKFR